MQTRQSPLLFLEPSSGQALWEGLWLYRALYKDCIVALMALGDLLRRFLTENRSAGARIGTAFVTRVLLTHGFPLSFAGNLESLLFVVYSFVFMQFLRHIVELVGPGECMNAHPPSEVIWKLGFRKRT